MRLLHPTTRVHCLQVIARRVTPPPLPRGLAEADPQLAALGRVMPPEVHQLFVYNRTTADRQRICPQCRTKYRWASSAGVQIWGTARLPSIM
jgi:hypothetical protein